MFSDPVTITINGVAKTLARVKTGDMESTYQTADGLLTLEIPQQPTKSSRARTTLRFTQKKVVTNPLDSSNDYDSTTWTHTFDRPGFGFSDVELFQVEAALGAFLTQTNVTKLYGHES